MMMTPAGSRRTVRRMMMMMLTRPGRWRRRRSAPALDWGSHRLCPMTMTTTVMTVVRWRDGQLAAPMMVVVVGVGVVVEDSRSRRSGGPPTRRARVGRAVPRLQPYSPHNSPDHSLPPWVEPGRPVRRGRKGGEARAYALAPVAAAGAAGAAGGAGSGTYLW
jgi:hypothetical protein